MTDSGSGARSRLFGAEHVRRYLDTGGEEGHEWEGVHTLILFSTGRRTGVTRATPLIYGRDRDRLLVVASRGGSASHPGWYFNLSEDPEVEAQVGGRRLSLRAVTAEPSERPRLWRLMTAVWPAYDAYQQRTLREIPVVVLWPRDPGSQ